MFGGQKFLWRRDIVMFGGQNFLWRRDIVMFGGQNDIVMFESR
jgi:hypothetical protein